MALFKKPDSIEILVDILERERRAVLSGNFEVLERIFPEKARALKALARIETAGNLPYLREMVARNQTLLESAAKGINSVSRLLAEEAEVPDLGAFYDARGRRAEVGHTKTGLERRA